MTLNFFTDLEILVSGKFMLTQTKTPHNNRNTKKSWLKLIQGVYQPEKPEEPGKIRE